MRPSAMMQWHRTVVMPMTLSRIRRWQMAPASLWRKKAAYGMASREKTIFDRLVAAGQRLVSVIQKCQGMANKDLSKFADQINALCDKWDR